jgi:hypothetical protein
MEESRVIRKRLSRLATVFTSATLALMLLGVGTVTASPPGWQFLNAVNEAPLVATENLAAWSFTIHNGGSSNISKLFLTDSLDQAAVFVKDDRNACVKTPVLFCDFGALNAGDSIDVLVVHTAPSTAGDFPITFQLNGSGETYSDGKGRSHGDTLNLTFDGKQFNDPIPDNPPVTVVSGASEFDGGYVVDAGATFSTGDTLTKKNPQYSSVVAPINLSAVTIQDLSSYGTGDPCGTNGLTCIGQWTKLSAPTAGGAKIKITLVIRGQGLPGSLTADDIVVYHDDDGIIGDVATERCASATDSASAPCIYVTEVGGNFQVVVWLTHNGNLRGGY